MTEGKINPDIIRFKRNRNNSQKKIGYRVYIGKRIISRIENGNKVPYFQYFARNDQGQNVTGRYLKSEGGKSLIEFINFVIDQFPVPVHTICTDYDREYRTMSFVQHLAKHSILHLSRPSWEWQRK